jgi:hypothetical protein
VRIKKYIRVKKNLITVVAYFMYPTVLWILTPPEVKDTCPPNRWLSRNWSDLASVGHRGVGYSLYRWIRGISTCIQIVQ